MSALSHDPVEALRDGLADRAPIDVTADLVLTVDGQPVRIESYTDLVTVDLPSVRAVVGLLGRHGGRGRALPDLLAAAGLTVEVTVDGTTVASVGDDADAGLLERGLGYSSVDVSPLGWLLALLRAPW